MQPRLPCLSALFRLREALDALVQNIHHRALGGVADLVIQPAGAPSVALDRVRAVGNIPHQTQTLQHDFDGLLVMLVVRFLLKANCHAFLEKIVSIVMVCAGNREPDGVPVDHKAIALEQFIGACESLDYETASRYPEQTTGKKTRISGKLTRTVDLPLVDLSLIAVADRNNIWFVIYRRSTQPQTGRILPGDVITVYGECEGLSNFLMGNGLLFEDWTTSVPAIASRYIVRNH